ncbi:MAG TPA: outer membrane beta-barrel protein [Gammaproteobacteria bacterium]|jgi:OOP family OmpA-OmpF porin|nr:outer membrane beta-barrel protein [Gammaproteobacteria bacterium]
MKRLYSISVLLGLAAFANSASAADSGWYAGVDLGSSNYAVMKPNMTALSQDLAQNGLPNTTTESDTATAYGVDVGYQFLRYFAVEGGYTDFGSATGDLNINLIPPGTAHIDLHAKGETLFAVGILPVSDSFSFFGKLGILTYTQDFNGSVSVAGVGSQTLPKFSDSGTTSGIGVGASWAINDRFGLRLGFTRFHAVGDENNTGQGTIDLGYLQFVVHF